ncbi:MAG TPA: hypothetical protein VF624_11120 [Tepidisphaeraceae bacterium]|jgi:hypothetical protein
MTRRSPHAAPPIAPLILSAVLAAAAPALAVKTEYFRQTTAADFRAGTTENVAISDRGELRLARAVKRLLPETFDVGAVTAMTTTADGAVIVGTFPDAAVLRIHDGKTETLATLKGKTITALAVDGAGRILVATAGERGEVIAIDKAGGKPQPVVSSDDIDYVWAILPEADGTLLLATGPKATVYAVDAGGVAKPLARLGGTNVTSLLAAGDTLYAGTDGEGLVYSIERKSGKKRLLFDAAEAEIVALARDARGDLLAAASDGKPSAAPPAATDETGGPEKAAPATLPADAPPSPKPQQPGVEPPDTHSNPTAGETPAAETETATTQPAVPQIAAGPVPPGVSAEGNAAGGNAVYKIGRDGFVSEVHRGAAVIHSMAATPAGVLIGTGDNGDLYELRGGDEEADITAHFDGNQVNAIIGGGGNGAAAVVATSNGGGVYALGDAGAAAGTFDSAALDTGTISRFGAIRVDGEAPAEGAIMLSARTGNAADPKSDDWSDWSKPQPAREINKIDLPPGRYVQYRVRLEASAGGARPALRGVTIAYQKPNVAPRVSSVTVAPAGDAQNPQNLSINWAGEDVNGDALRYSVAHRVAGRGDWVELARDLEATTFVWPGRQAADGRYEIRVTATDAGDNEPGHAATASRISTAFTVDNAAPVIGDVTVDAAGEKPAVRLRVVDRGGTLAALAYSVDRANLWQKCLPDDTIADSPEERYTLPLTGLVKGRHTLTVRATDENGNAAFEVVGVTIP